MLPDIDIAVRLQSLDDRLAALGKEVSELPKHVAAIEKKLENHLKRVEADRAALVANQKERRKLELDIQGHEQKISKLKGQMMDAKTNDIYNAFQHEIGFCTQEIGRIEDRILELMGESEPLEKAVKAAEGELAVERKQVE
jgi:predicted  nucleic acid-binding Zn-ribbon protein